MGATVAGWCSRRGSFTTASALRTDAPAGSSGRQRRSRISAAVDVLRTAGSTASSAAAGGADAPSANSVSASALRLDARRASLLYGWSADGVGSTGTREGPGRTQRNTISNTISNLSTGDPGPFRAAALLRWSSGPSTPGLAGTSSASSPPQDGAARAAAGRLGIFSPAGVLCSAAGPAWTRGELEPPQGAKRTASGFATAVYTPEQQVRLGVDEASADEATRSGVSGQAAFEHAVSSEDSAGAETARGSDALQAMGATLHQIAGLR